MTDERMDDLVRRARSAALIWVGGPYGNERFSEEVFKATLDQLITNERLKEQNEPDKIDK